MPKMKPHKGLLKRIRITKTGKVKHNKAGYKHLRSHKSADRLRRLRKGSIMSAADTRRIARLLGRRLRGRTQPLSAIRRNPSPAERKAAREQAKAGAASS